MVRCAIIARQDAFGIACKCNLIELNGYHDSDIAVRTMEREALTQDGVYDFHILRAWLTEQIELAGPAIIANGFVVITDLHHGHFLRLEQLDPLRRGTDSRRLLGMLIMAFPEVHWLFAGTSSFGLSSDDFWGAAHISPTLDGNAGSERRDRRVSIDALRLASFGYVALFDGTGLRSALRKVMGGGTNQSNGPFAPVREACAVSIDDEAQYALFHSYTAYRFGFRAVPVYTYNLATTLFGEGRHEDLGGIRSRTVLVFEDIFLDLPDGGAGFSDFQVRSRVLSGLNTVPHRIFVTTGQRLRGDQPRRSRNVQYLRDQQRKGQHFEVIHKPRSGMFSVWQHARLARFLRWIAVPNDEWIAVPNGKRYRGVGKGFQWPPHNGTSRTATEQPHSAPGVLQDVASSLVERAERLRDQQIISFGDALRGAVLATDALELLAGRAPTTSIDALTLKHEFEVLAECRFSGAEYEIQLEPRFREISRDVAMLSRYFEPSQRRTAALNAEIRIISALLRIFRENAQYDEEQACMNRVRHLRNSLWLGQHRRRFVLWPVIRYIELMLSSFMRFLVVIVGWIALLSALYVITAPHTTWYLGVEDAVTSFFSMGGPIHESVSSVTMSFAYVSVVCFSIVAGCLHLGIFISHLYSLVARK